MKEKIQEIYMIYAQNGIMLTQAQTSRLLGKTRGRIAQMINEKKITAVECLGTKMIPLSEIIKIIKAKSADHPACSATPE